MGIRRVVVSNDSGGKSTVQSDGLAPRSTDLVSSPGMSVNLLWTTPDHPTVGNGPVADDGQTVTLGKHEVAVQHGTRHGWRNASDQPATMLFVLTGADRVS